MMTMMAVVVMLMMMMLKSKQKIMSMLQKREREKESKQRKEAEQGKELNDFCWTHLKPCLVGVDTRLTLTSPGGQELIHQLAVVFFSLFLSFSLKNDIEHTGNWRLRFKSSHHQGGS